MRAIIYMDDRGLDIFANFYEDHMPSGVIIDSLGIC